MSDPKTTKKAKTRQKRPKTSKTRHTGTTTLYKTHMFVHNPDGQRKFTCEVCGKSVNEARTFKRHMMIHNNEFTCRCTVCDKGFIRHDKMMDHVKRVHSEYYNGKVSGQNTGQITGQIN